MSEKKELHIKFRIQRIETLQFAVLKDEITEDRLSYSVRFGFGIDPEAFLVRSTFHYELLSEGNAVLLIEVAVDFAIDADCFKKEFFKEDKLFIEKDFAGHLAVIAVGTTRGILHEKTKETKLSAFLIPTVNVAQQITEDVFIDME
jgi:hypothetical protein